MDDGESLRELCKAVKVLHRENYGATLLLMGGVCASMHYRLLMEHLSEGSIPIFLASGPPGCGKTSALRSALSMAGCNQLLHRKYNIN